MDWKYILSLSPEDVSEQNVEEIYGTLAWHDFDDEVLDGDAFVKVIKICQEIMKYKSEQVQTLVTELDELAVKQAEEEVKKIESDTDGRSSKSRRSPSSLEFSELEQKYAELKAKYKLQLKANDKSKKTVKELQQKISDIEQERNNLLLELQTTHQDGSQSDISENIKEQHQELMETLHHKNKQLQNLLEDIEAVEKENLMLREKLSNARDELSDATTQLTKISDEISSYKVRLDETTAALDKYKLENQALQNEITELVEQKNSYEQQVEEFTSEINERVDNWKKILDQKNSEIKKLKSQLESRDTSPSSQPSDNQQSKELNIAALNKALYERENKIEELRTELQSATKEMEETAQSIKDLTIERDSGMQKVNQLTELQQELKNQLKSAHERCQDLQKQVVYFEKICKEKDKDFRELFSNLKKEGAVELSDVLAHVQNLKSENHIKEKRLEELVDVSNRLQEALDGIHMENEAMRSKLGLKENESVSIGGVIINQRKQKKMLKSIQEELNRIKEEKLEKELEIQNLNRVVANLSDQVINLGGKPQKKTVEGKLKKATKPVEQKDDQTKEMMNLVEENEALRKGLHEILSSVNKKKETHLKTINSTTLEKLLRALDVKHVSGWYHPAMRLQAEIHTLQGINSELREQLRVVKLELHSYKEKTATISVDSGDNALVKDVPQFFKEIPENLSASELEIINNLNQHLLNVLQHCKQIEKENKLMKDKLETYKTDFTNVEERYNKITEEIKTQTEMWNSKLQDLENRNRNLEEKAEISESKVKEFITHTNFNEDNFAKAQHSAELAANIVSLNRKCVYLETEEMNLKNKIKQTEKELLDSNTSFINISSKFERKEKELLSKIEILEVERKSLVDKKLLLDTQENLDVINLKYKQLLKDFEKVCNENKNEIAVLNQWIKDLQKDKKEVTEKLKDAMGKLYSKNDKTEEQLSKKLSECEVNEISERQRANHINNLYELVKEQLQKSEDRFKEFELYNKEIMHKNLVFQDTLKDLQNNILNSVDLNVYKELEEKYTLLIQEKEKLEMSNSDLQEELKVLKTTLTAQKLWTSAQEYEFLSLKHQLVDLQAVTDDKTVIARLSTDVVQARLSEAKSEKKISELTEVLEEIKSKCGRYEDLLSQEKERCSSHLEQSQKKIIALQNVIEKQRLVYLGSMPLLSLENYIHQLKQLTVDKNEALKSMYNAQKYENECEILKEELEKQLGSDKDKLATEKCGDQKDSRSLQLQELKYRRLSEFKENQLRQAYQRLEMQDDHIAKLEVELLQAYQNTNPDGAAKILENDQHEVEKTQDLPPRIIKLFNSQESQTCFELIQTDKNFSEQMNILQAKLINTESNLSQKESLIEQLRGKITELEMNISLFRKQIGDKQSQINFYEKHILELQSKKQDLFNTSENGSGDSSLVQNNEEVLTLKASVQSLQTQIKEKEDTIVQYQSLIKRDRDEHSLAAARMQEELRRLQNRINEHQKSYQKLQETSGQSHPSKAAIEQYVLQVHKLEEHTAELHTQVTSLNSQLQASRQESVRWRCLANDRLENMEQLRKDLEEQHQNEIQTYREDSEKWRQEVSNLKILMSKHRSTSGQSTIDNFNKLLKEKDDRIHELSVLLRQAKTESKKVPEKEKTEEFWSPKLNEIIMSKEQLYKEHETLKKRYDQLLNRERLAKEEIRNLQTQLSKRPILSARSEKSEKSVKDQLQKKINFLEKEVETLKENLERQLAINETHRIKIAEDFNKWNKQKHWQQTAEKLKNKLKEKEEAFEKQHQTSAGYRILIERLEREKHNLEARIKNLKSQNTMGGGAHLEMLRSENMKLQSQIEVLTTKLEMNQYHSGGLGAAMLQDKLESQERKIAVLELAAKGSVEVRTELERLHATVADLQKKNLCLEAENLELRLDLEKSSNEVPHLREQIQHLENYIDVLKKENNGQTSVPVPEKTDNGTRKVAELEKTVFVLKRVVEKLQVENKRLLSGSRACTLPERSAPTDSLRRDLTRTRQEYGDAVQKVARLERELAAANGKIASLESNKHSADVALVRAELEGVKLQLDQKSALLDKIKVLLHKAAVREKELLDEISRLKSRMGSSLTPDTEY